MRVYEYQISERSTLKRGTPFRATEGPYYVTETGEQISMSGRSPYIFLWAETVKDCEYLHCLDKDGLHEVLHVTGERTSSIEGMVCRPYRLRNRMIKNLHKVKALRTKLPKIKKGRKKRNDRQTTE